MGKVTQAIRAFWNWVIGVPTLAPVAPSEHTQARLYAAAYAARLALQVLTTQTRVRRVCFIVMLVAFGVSYPHQADYLASLGMEVWAAYLLPGANDMLTMGCVLVLATAAIKLVGRVVAACALLLSISGSGALNYLAPGHTTVKVVFAASVAMIAIAETVSSQIKPDFAAMERIELAMIPPDINHDAVTTAPEPTTGPEPATVATAAASPARKAARRRKPPASTQSKPVRRRRPSVQGHPGVGTEPVVTADGPDVVPADVSEGATVQAVTLDPAPVAV